ncbi:MAG TPA: alpha-glucosidase/alpha-galactosidase [Planctomycetota bacterium]|nr:alpha-glucosidase/alpha-galactosidase [Planctomycetota bacterium]
MATVKPNVTFLGAGSGFTAGVLRDVMLIPDLAGGELRLVDIDRKRLEITTRLIKKLAEHMKAKHGVDWKVTGTPDRRKVLPGTDYVINCIEVSGTACVRHDNDIPLKYGIDQCIGDTIGPGGIFKALRTVPAWLDILADIERLCPEALVLNYTNPMSIMTLAAVRSTRAQVVGLCHSVQGTSKKMARVANVPFEEMRWRCGGINHLAWLTELSHNGRDLYPKIFKRAREDREVYESDPVRFDMMFHFGAFITESSGHLSEYLPYYRKRADLLKKYARDGYRGGSSFYADNWPQWRKDCDRRRDELAKDLTKMDLNRGHEYASDIIEAHALNRPKVIYGSVLNAGLIPNLPADGVVEVATLVNKAGFNPCRFGELPPQMAAVCASHMRVYDLVVRGLKNRDRESIYHAMQLDPLSAAVCAPAELRAMTDEMALAEKDFIPAWMTKGLGKVSRRGSGKVTVGIGLKKTKDKGPFAAG